MSTERRIKPLVVALIVSVSLNMFGAGFLLASRFGRHGERMRPAAPLGPHGFLARAGLGEDPELHHVLQQRREKLRAERDELMQARRSVRTALGAEPFEPAQLRGALQALHTHTSAMQYEMHETLVELAQRLPASKRQRLARAPWLLGPEQPEGPPHMGPPGSAPPH